MKKIYLSVLVLVLSVVFFPFVSYASGPIPKQKTFTGIVTQSSSFQITVRTSTASVYTAQINEAKLFRKNGTTMQASEILTGDKVEVSGLLWPDGSVNAQRVRNLSLYVHNTTFTGKIVEIKQNGFTMQNKGEIKNISTDLLTVYKKNGSASTLSVLEPGISVKVKGAWERDSSVVLAKSVDASIRLVNIEFTGQLVSKSENGFTVVADNAIYGVDITKAKLVSKNNKVMFWDEFLLGQTVKVSGKHISEKVQVAGVSVKNVTQSK